MPAGEKSSRPGWRFPGGGGFSDFDRIQFQPAREAGINLTIGFAKAESKGQHHIACLFDGGNQMGVMIQPGLCLDQQPIDFIARLFFADRWFLVDALSEVLYFDQTGIQIPDEK